MSLNRRQALGAIAVSPVAAKSAVEQASIGGGCAIEQADCALLAEIPVSPAQKAFNELVASRQEAARLREQRRGARHHLTPLRPSIASMKSWSDAAKVEAELDRRHAEHLAEKAEWDWVDLMRKRVAAQFGIEDWEV